MPEGFVQVDEGTGKKLHTFSRTIAPNSVHDEVVIPGEPYLATYSAAHSGVLLTVAGHAMQIMAGASLPLRIQRIQLGSTGGVAGSVILEVKRLTTAGTGGTVQTPAPYDTSDAASGATARTLPTALGTEGALLLATRMGWPSASADSQEFLWVAKDNVKPIYVPAGVTNGICIKHSAIAVALAIVVEFTEAAF